MCFFDVVIVCVLCNYGVVGCNFGVVIVDMFYVVFCDDDIVWFLGFVVCVVDVL